MARAWHPDTVMEPALAALRIEFGVNNVRVVKPVDGRAGGVGIRRTAHRWVVVPLTSLSSVFFLDYVKQLLENKARKS